MSALRLFGKASLSPGKRDEDAIAMARWHRLDDYGRALAMVATRTLDGKSIAPGTALYVVSERSCAKTNTAFHRSFIEHNRPSPLLFAYTLPSAAPSELTAHLGLHGESITISGASAAELATLLLAKDALLEPGTNEVLVLGAEGDGHAAGLWLGVDHRESAKIVRIEGALGAAVCEDFGGLIDRALIRAKTSPQMLDRIYLASPRTTALDLPVIEVSSPSCRGLLAVLMALDEGGVSLILAADETASAAVVISAPRP